MSRNDFALIRHRAMDKCFKNKHRHYHIYDLAKVCTEAIEEFDGRKRDNLITIRQIRKDIVFMESESGYRAEIERYTLPGDKKVYFRYANPEYSIAQSPLTDDDAEQLRNTVLTLQRFKGLPQFDWIEEFSAKLKQLNGLDKPQTAISFDRSNFLEGLRWIDPLYLAVINNAPLKVDYAPFNKTLETHLISPYLLKQYNKRWFVLCHSDRENYLTNLALDRILDVQPLKHKFTPYPGDNPEDFFEDIIGVTNYSHEDVQTVILEVEKSLWPYIKTKPIHDSQKSIKASETGDWVTVQLEIKTNYEFYALILSHGAGMRIVAPDSAKNKIRSLIQEMSLHYRD
jgi:predicted DNA-binding transcriptional regulator YafY